MKIAAAERLPEKMVGKEEESHNKMERQNGVWVCQTHTFNPISSGLQRLRPVGNWTRAEKRWSLPPGPAGYVFLLLFLHYSQFSFSFYPQQLSRRLCTTAISHGRNHFLWNQSKLRRRGRWQRDHVITRMKSGLGGRVCCETTSWRTRTRIFLV